MDILLIDDEVSFLQSLAEGLAGLHSRRRINVVFAHNGKKAIEMLRTAKFDMVLTDLKMPVMDGYQVLEYLSHKHPNVPVIVMTGLGCADVERQLRRFNIKQFLEKPIDFRMIANAVLALKPKWPHTVSR